MMPGMFGGGQNAQPQQPRQPFGPQLKQALITAAPMFTAMAAGYSSGRGPYAYMDQGAAMMQENLKRKRDEEAAAAAAAAFGALAPPGGNAGGAGGGWGAGGAYTGTNKPPAPLRADAGVFGGGKGGLTFGKEPADTGSVAKGGLSFGPGTGMGGYTRYEAQYGLPEGYLERTAQIESGGNPNAQNPNSSAGGLFQFIDSTAAQYGLQNKFDPEQATDAAARLAADNAAHLRGVLGREPTAAELYLAHQQGAGGAARLLANPNARAADIVGADAVRLNGGDLNMTAGQFASKWTGKFGGGGGTASAGGAAPSGPVDPLSDPYVQRLMQVMALPGLTPEQRSVVELQLQTRMGQLTAENPDAEEERARARRARDAEMLGLRPGTGEFNQYVVTGEMPQAPKPIEVGGVLLDPVTMEPIFDSRNTAGLDERYKVVGGTLFDLGAEGGPKPVGEGSMQEEVIMGPDGKPMIVRGGTGTAAKFTEAQSKDNVYATRAEGALAELDPVADALVSREGMLDAVPFGLGREMQSDQFQTAQRAGKEFLATILRKDTGAAVTPSEEAMYGEIFLPMPGDGPAVVEAKRVARTRAVEAIKAGMSPDQIITMGRALMNTAGRTGVAQPSPDGSMPSAAVAPINGTTASGITWSLGE